MAKTKTARTSILSRAVALWVTRRVAGRQRRRRLATPLSSLTWSMAPSNSESADRLIALSRSLGLATYVRVACPTAWRSSRLWTRAPMPSYFSQVRDLEHARCGAAFAKYPGLGLRRDGNASLAPLWRCPRRFCSCREPAYPLLIMIETPGALRDVEEIVALPTVDGVFMGPYDLSLTTGRGQYGATRKDGERSAYRRRREKGREVPRRAGWRPGGRAVCPGIGRRSDFVRRRYRSPQHGPS